LESYLEQRIRWNDEEKAALKRRFDEFRLAGDGFLLAFNKAQDEVLPKDRRRTINTRGAVPWLDGKPTPRLSKLLQQQEEQKRREREAEEARIRQEEEAAAQRAMDREFIKAEILSSLTLADIVDIVQRQVISAIEGAIDGKLRHHSDDPHRQNQLLPPPPPPPKKPRILVVGLKGHQHDELRNTFKNASVEIITMTADRANSSNNTMPSNVDHVIGITKFIQHPLDKKLHNLYGEVYERYPKSIDSLKGHIRAMSAGLRRTTTHH
jgi:hypothetical protein